jgi:N-acetylmuramoyl-L-alanine amidase
MLPLLLALLLASPSVQDQKLDDAQARLEKLRSDARRRRYRDGWESVLRELAAALKAAPKGARAAEASLAAAKVRVQLFEVSRSPADARSALAALRKVDEDYPGPAGLQALHAAVQLSWHTKDPGDRAAAAKRLIERYPASDEAKAVAARTAALAGVAAPTSAPSSSVSAESKKPVSVGDDEESDGDEAAPEPEAPADPPSRSTPIVRAVKTAVAALTEADDEQLTPAQARELRTAALRSGTPLAAQLGLKVRRVVVDAGHGGRDTGAIGPHGAREKDMTLAIARKVAARLKTLGFRVMMTRTRDTFVPLDERTRIANEAHADVFVSIHCNAARRRKLQGVETWTLNVSGDRYAARLAAFENAEAERTVSDLRLILADLATKANAGDARDLAQSVQSSLVRTLRSRVGPVRDHGVKQALFYVLLGTHMPSILVETGFISNPAEESRLKSSRFQEGTAEAIARGLKDFVDSRRRLASVP